MYIANDLGKWEYTYMYYQVATSNHHEHLMSQLGSLILLALQPNSWEDWHAITNTGAFLSGRSGGAALPSAWSMYCYINYT